VIGILSTPTGAPLYDQLQLTGPLTLGGTSALILEGIITAPGSITGVVTYSEVMGHFAALQLQVLGGTWTANLTYGTTSLDMTIIPSKAANAGTPATGPQPEAVDALAAAWDRGALGSGRPMAPPAMSGRPAPWEDARIFEDNDFMDWTEAEGMGILGCLHGACL
jgi:hypothetical protein